ncbi:MAG: class I SAM-dependent methyltransferase [Chloroflexota bacterium]|nr:class I SAM-dependent methyltransferase [Chloroflexota bacterium]
MDSDARKIALEAKGFLSEAEGLRLYAAAAEISRVAPCLEVGSYCGKSTIFLAAGCRAAGSHPLFAVDHHRGSAEQQFGELYFDPEFYDETEGIVSTLDAFMRNVRRAGLLDWVVPVVTESRTASRYWPNQPISLLFIDGGHSEEDAFQDYNGWSGHVVRGGYLCIHDIYTDPAEGGQAPLHVLQHALASGSWEFVEKVDSLVISKRL